MAAKNWTLEQVLKQLNSGSAWSGPEITYSFPDDKSDLYTAGGEGKGFSAFSAVQVKLAEYALVGWDDLIAIDFREVSGGSDIEFGNTTTGIDYAHAYFPDIGSVWLNPKYDDVSNPVVGDYGFSTIIHELGHALGLDHMGDYNGSGTWAPSSYQDTTVLSIMSYFGPDSSDGEGDVMWADWSKGGKTYSAQTPMLNDIMAIQYIYGVETSTRTGDTVYGFNSNITGSAAQIFDFTKNENPILTIFDSGGTDTIDLSGYSSESVISLVAGTFTNTNQMTNNIAIAYSAVIENAVGGAADDTITGNDADNKLTGNGGDDTIDGGAGKDIAVFKGAYADYTIVQKGNGTYIVTDNAGSDGKDTLIDIETLRFKDRDFGGDVHAPSVATAIADQSIETGQSFFLSVPVGTFSDPDGDALAFSASLGDGRSLPSWLTFDATTMSFYGTPGDGDAGTLSVKVTASDGSESASDEFQIVIGDGGGDPGEMSYIYGTGKANVLVGTSAQEMMFGMAGKDYLYGGDANDILNGGKGRDFLWGDAGADMFTFSVKSGRDDIQDFSSAQGDRIDLSDIAAITSYQDLMQNHMRDVDGGALIRISKKDDIWIWDVDKADLDKGDFLF
jgi:serralysin